MKRAAPSELDLLIRGGLAALPDRIAHVDLGIHRGQIVVIGQNLEYRSHAILEASGLLLLPGVIDTAVDFAGAGRGYGPDFLNAVAANSSALAAGGGTFFCDLAGGPGRPIATATELLRKREALLSSSRVDFALWAGVSESNLDQMPALRDAGAVGFHAALAAGGENDPPPVTPKTLRRIMERAARLRLPLQVAVESGGHVTRARLVVLAGAGHGARAYAASRPVEAEVEGARIALDLAGETGCALHLAPVTLLGTVELVDAAKARGVDVTCGTAPHYLLFSQDEAIAAGTAERALWRPAPPLRSHAARDGLREAFAAERIDTVASHHTSMAPGGYDLLLPGGIAGCQHAFPALWTELTPDPGPAFAAAVARSSERAARRFRLDRRKGTLTVGRDADITLLDLEEPHAVPNESLLYPYRQSAYASRTALGRIVRTLQRGETVYANGQFERRRAVVCLKPGDF